LGDENVGLVRKISLYDRVCFSEYLQRWKSLKFTKDEFLALFFNGASRIKKCEGQLRRITRDLQILVVKFIQADGEIFEHLLLTVTNLSFKQ
jgi:hypothetical protein